MKKYQIIYSDPPWQFKNYSDAWHDKHKESKWVGKQYGCMSLNDIERLPISDIADKDCVLLLWTTYPSLEKAFGVIKAWGFKYKTCAFTWVKKNKKANSWFWGMGFWTRSNAEICLLATKGSPKRVSMAVHSVVDSRIEKHSKKPDEVRTRIVKLMGNLPRIELFARQKTDGWDVWGNEVESDIELQSNKEAL